MTHIKRILLLLFLFAAACAPTNTAAPEPTAEPEAGGLNEAAQAEIYAAVVRRIYTQDDTFGGQLNPATLYLMRTTDDQTAFGDDSFEVMEPVTLAESLQQAITAALADLPAAIVWVDSRDEVPMKAEEGDFVEDGALITLGNIHSQDDGTILVPNSIYVANLAAGGRTYIMEQGEAGWTITGTTGVEWMS